MYRVSESLLAELTAGAAAPGMQLDGVGELAERLGVGASTIRAAIDALVGAGYLTRRGATGVYVTAPDACVALS